MRLFKWKEKVDERERMEMYRNEHYVFWFFFWALVVKVLVYKCIFFAPMREYICEMVILLLGSIWLCVMDFRDGHYDYHTTPGWKSYLFYTVVFSIFFTAFMLAGGIRQGWFENVQDGLIVGAVDFVVFFVLIYGSMVVLGAVTRWRRRKLEEKLLKDEDA